MRFLLVLVSRGPQLLISSAVAGLAVCVHCLAVGLRVASAVFDWVSVGLIVLAAGILGGRGDMGVMVGTIRERLQAGKQINR